MALDFIESTPADIFMTNLRKASLKAIQSLAKRQHEGERLRKDLELKRAGLDENDYEYVLQTYQLQIQQERELEQIIQTPSYIDLKEKYSKYLPTTEVNENE